MFQWKKFARLIFPNVTLVRNGAWVGVAGNLLERSWIGSPAGQLTHRRSIIPIPTLYAHCPSNMPSMNANPLCPVYLPITYAHNNCPMPIPYAQYICQSTMATVYIVLISWPLLCQGRFVNRLCWEWWVRMMRENDAWEWCVRMMCENDAWDFAENDALCKIVKYPNQLCQTT